MKFNILEIKNILLLKGYFILESEPTNQGPIEEATSNNEDELAGAASGSKKPSKAQKRREKKEKSEAEREIEIAK